MIVADLQRFLTSLGDALTSSGASKVAGELTTVAEGFGPFREMKLKDFSTFLAFAEQVKREGYPPPKTPGKRTPAVSKEPAISVQEATDLFTSLYDRARQPEVTPELVASEAKKLESLKKGELDAVASGVGLSQKFKTKGDVIATLQKRIVDRKGMDQRAQQ